MKEQKGPTKTTVASGGRAEVHVSEGVGRYLMSLGTVLFIGTVCGCTKIRWTQIGIG